LVEFAAWSEGATAKWVRAVLPLSGFLAADYDLAVTRRSARFGQGIAMNGSSFLNKKVLGAFVLVLMLGAAALVWVERMPLLAWYYVHKLAKADEADRGVWVDRVAGLGEPALGDLFECLNDASSECCANARLALEKLTARWGNGDTRTISLALRCGREFPRMSPAGRRNVLELAAGWFKQGPPEAGSTAGLVPPGARLLAEAAATKDTDVQTHALELCGVLTRQPQASEALSSARELVRVCLASDKPEVRVRAVQLTLEPGMDLSEEVVSLLADPAVEVRRAAMLAVGPSCPANDGIVADALMPNLHDSDEEVRALCDKALRSRNLTPKQIKLAWQLYHPDPAERNKVFHVLFRSRELDPTRLLDQLSHDPAESVRSNALSAMAMWNPEAMRQVVVKMAEQDPAETVRDLAKKWLDNPRTFIPGCPD
jgi:hypothetical protein